MSASKTLAFVLKTQDYRDTSLLGDFYTRDFGRIRGVVKGARGTRGAFGSTLEPFSLNEILFYRRRRGGDLHLVTNVELIDSFIGVREDLERLAAASYCIELLSELVEAEFDGPEIFDLLHDTLRFLAGGASPRRAARIFEVKLLDELGLMPEVKQCVRCRAEAPEPAFFNPAFGGIVCQNCRKSASGDGSGLPVSRGTLNFLDHVRRAPFTELGPVKVVREVGEETERVLRRFTDFHLSNRLKTLIFMEKMGF